MSSATPSEPLTPFSKQLASANALYDWEIDVSCTPHRRFRTEKLLALVEQTWFTFSKIMRAFYKETERPSPSFEVVCLLLIKQYNSINHLNHVMNTERLLRDDPAIHRKMPLRDDQAIDPEVKALDHKLKQAVGYNDFLRNAIQSHVNRVHWMGYGGPHDPELKFWLYQSSSYFTPSAVPGISMHYSWKLLQLRTEFMGLAHGFHLLQTSLDEQVLIGNWYRPSPVSYRRGARDRSRATRSALDDRVSTEGMFQVKRLRDVCNSFVVELAAIAKTANVRNYATLQRARTDRTWLSPSLDWAHRFLDRTKEGLTGRGLALASLIGPHVRSLEYDTRADCTEGTKDVDYYSYQRLLGQNIGGISFGRVEPYFPLWQTVDAMVGVLADLLDVSFQKLDTSAAGLDKGIAAYDVSEQSEDGIQRKYLGRLYLELARDSPRLHGYGDLPRGGLWVAKTLTHPEVETLQSPYDDPIDGVHRGGSVIVRTYWASQEDRDTHLQLDNVERLFHAIGSALHVLLVKHNCVRFNEIDCDHSKFPAELKSMVGTVFGRLARHPAVLRRITRHPHYHDDRAKDTQEVGPVPAKEMPAEMIDGIVKCTQFETLRGALESLTVATMDRKIMTIASVEEAKKFDVATAWNETVLEIQQVGLGVPKSSRDHGYATEARTTFSHASHIEGYSYIIGEAIGLDVFTSKLAAKGIFDNKCEWGRFRQMILSLSPTRKPDYMAKIEEYLGRPFNQDIFVDCTNEVEEQLKQQQAECEAALKIPSIQDVDIWATNGSGEFEYWQDSEETDYSEEELKDSEDQSNDSEEDLKNSKEQLKDSEKQLKVLEKQLDEAKGTEEGPDDEYDVLAREEAVTA